MAEFLQFVNWWMYPFTSITDLDARAVMLATHADHFPHRSARFLETAFTAIEQLFAGKLPGYLPCDLPYHNFLHTCETVVTLAHLLDGHLRRNSPPQLTGRDYELAVTAMLLHDTGYLRTTHETFPGTGARFTRTHVERSVALANQLLPAWEFTAAEQETVRIAIRATAFPPKICVLPDAAPRETFLARAVASADLIGQLAAPDYPERLPLLFAEFKEAATDTAEPMFGYHNVDDLRRQTRAFFEQTVLPLLENELGGVHHALAHHFPDGVHHYLRAIETNLQRIQLASAPAR
ncbi:MAG: hypothetical protein NZ483_01340 [Verrucomicrobiae bacterium]|nr:hypothetical protein [Verrucomicrobiae bacterium]